MNVPKYLLWVLCLATICSLHLMRASAVQQPLTYAIPNSSNKKTNAHTQKPSIKHRVCGRIPFHFRLSLFLFRSFWLILNTSVCRPFGGFLSSNEMKWNRIYICGKFTCQNNIRYSCRIHQVNMNDAIRSQSSQDEVEQTIHWNDFIDSSFV